MELAKLISYIRALRAHIVSELFKAHIPPELSELVSSELSELMSYWSSWSSWLSELSKLKSIDELGSSYSDEELMELAFCRRARRAHIVFSELA